MATVTTLPKEDKTTMEPVSTLTPDFDHALKVLVATLQAERPDLADALGRANAVLVNGRFFPAPDGQSAIVLAEEDPGLYYHLCRSPDKKDTCTCPDAEYHPKDVCKHRYALRLYQRVLARLAAQDQDEHDEDPSSGVDLATIPKEYLHYMHGKPHVLYKGLLAMAQERGLTSLKARLTSVTSELAVAEAEATFQDGRSFSEGADATPTNVGNKTIAPHFPRMALTRAKARALRDALGIGIVSKEEVG